MRRTIAVLALAAGALACAPTPASAQLWQLPILDQVEEDWEVVVSQPEASVAGPQISTQMSPVTDDSTPCFVLDLNYRDSPAFSPGGMQVHVWDKGSILSYVVNGTDLLATPGEKITWTQRMRLSSGKLYFSVVNGQSTTWGEFGQGNDLNVSGNFTTQLTSLWSYRPDTSVNNSGVGWERNRVTSMKLVEVRYYIGGRLIWTDRTDRSVDLSQ